MVNKHLKSQLGKFASGLCGSLKGDGQLIANSFHHLGPGRIR